MRLYQIIKNTFSGVLLLFFQAHYMHVRHMSLGGLLVCWALCTYLQTQKVVTAHLHGHLFGVLLDALSLANLSIAASETEGKLLVVH